MGTGAGGNRNQALDVKRVLWLVLKYGTSAACLVYVFMDVPLADLSAALGRYQAGPILGAVAVSFAAYAVMGLRLSYMTAPPLSFRSTFCATLVGLAVNNVLPAKAGEIAKALWIGRENGVPSQKVIGIVFMERFFDVNVLALLSFWLLWVMEERRAVAIFVACLAVGWCVLALFKIKRPLAERFTKLFGGGRLGGFVSQALSGVLENMSPARLSWLLVTSLALWGFYTAQMFLCLNAVAGLGLGWEGVLSVFAVSGLSMLLPSSPGAIGVYEALTVTLLKRWGVEQDEALAIALVSHMVQFVPVTLSGALIFAAFPDSRARR
jgi:uncharacterized protein (TIRG00374 family)